MNKYYVYRHIRLDTNTPFYVGKGLSKRAFHKSGRNNYWNNITTQYDYVIEIIMDGLTEEQAFEKEIEFIKLYKDLGYCEANITLGGEGVSGLRPWNKGKTNIFKASAQLREKRKANSTQLWQDAEYRNKVVAAAQIGNNTIESKEKRKQSIKKHWKDIRGMSAINVWSVKQIKRGVYEDVTFIGEFESAQKASIVLNIDPRSISGCLTKRRKQTKGYRFEYV